MEQLIDFGDEPRMKVLAEMILCSSVEDVLSAMELPEGMEIEISLPEGRFYAKGPGVVYAGFLPKEVFEED